METTPAETISPEQLFRLLPGEWKGTCRTWFEPGQLADESETHGDDFPDAGSLVSAARVHGNDTIQAALRRRNHCLQQDHQAVRNFLDRQLSHELCDHDVDGRDHRRRFLCEGGIRCSPRDTALGMAGRPTN